MRETIICIGRTAEKPYCFPETGISVSSYEEICYYFSNYMICYLYTLPEEEFLYFIREELGLDKLYRQLVKLTDADRDQMKYFSALFREGSYFSEDEIRRILDEYRNLKNLPYSLQSKRLGDVYLRAGRASMAIHCYGEALKQGELEGKEAGAVCHNRGIALARLFRFHDAKIQFVKAYQHGGEEESLFCYYCMIALTEGLEKARRELEGFQVSELSQEAFESRFAEANEAFDYSEEAVREEKLRFLMENGKEEEGGLLYKKTVRDFQKAFRRELDVDENLLTVNVPVPRSDAP
ncbi:MAG: hypothetical protein Q4D60_02585 [Eubacteriales bacterium]|nr:hypothetical protein [Eubacteriales bacterium]